MTNSLKRARATLLILSVTAGLGGCGGGFEGVELNGKIFDALGVSGDGPFGKKVEPKTQARAPLVLPPDANRLPEPGSTSTIQTGALQADPAWPKDRDATRVSETDARKKAQEEFCKKDGNWRRRPPRMSLRQIVVPTAAARGRSFPSFRTV